MENRADMPLTMCGFGDAAEHLPPDVLVFGTCCLECSDAETKATIKIQEQCQLTEVLLN